MHIHRGKIENPQKDQDFYYNALCDIQEQYITGKIKKSEATKLFNQIIEERIVKELAERGIKAWYKDGKIMNYYEPIADDEE